jgi:hypothetical protein
MTAKVMFSFPDQLVTRMKAAIPQRERSKLVALLLEKEIQKREQHLYACAQDLEKDATLRKKAAEWDKEFGKDGLEDI